MKMRAGLLVFAFAVIALFAASVEAGCWSYGGACDSNCSYGQVSGPISFYLSDGGVCASSHCGTTNSLYSFTGACSPVGIGNCYIKAGTDRGSMPLTCTNDNGTSCGGSCTGSTYKWAIWYCGAAGTYLGGTCLVGGSCSPGFSGWSTGCFSCPGTKAVYTCTPYGGGCDGMSQTTCQSTPGCSWIGQSYEKLSNYSQAATSYGTCSWKLSVGESCSSDSQCSTNYCNEKNNTCTVCNTGRYENATDRCCGDDGDSDLGHLSRDMKYLCINTSQYPWQWINASSANRIGDIYDILSGGNYSVLSNGSTWIACNIGNGLGGFSGYNLTTKKIVNLSSHEYLCYDYNDAGTFAECRGDSATLNQGPANETGINQFKTGETIGELVCMANGEWECAASGFYFNGSGCIEIKYLFINGQTNNLAINSREFVNATFTSSSGTLYRNGVNVTSENGVLKALAMGYYNYTLVVPASGPYPKLIFTIFLNVTNATRIILPPHVYESCFDYADQFSCNEDDGGVAQIGCTGGRVCSCSWNSTANNCGMVSRNPNATCDSEFKCVFTPVNYSGSVCGENGFKTIQLSANLQKPLPQCSGSSDPDCVDKVLTVPCRSVGFDLPFFGPWQFISSIIMIAVIYGILGIVGKRDS